MPLSFETTYDSALAKARDAKTLAMLQFHSPYWVACRELETATFPRIDAMGTVPFQANVMKDRDLAKKFRVPWTPTFVFVDGDGLEHHRFIGYLPPDEFAAQVELAFAREAFGKGDFVAAQRRYQGITDRFSRSDAAPEALYWTGVCEFKQTKDEQRIFAKCREVVKRYPGHIWAKKLEFVK